MDITPRELSEALDDHAEYHSINDKHAMVLMRHIGLIIRNRGVKQMHHINDPKRFYPLWWEFDKTNEVEILTEDQWKALDKKYSRPTSN